MAASTVSPYILLKDGTGPPIFVAHGLAGTVQVSKLAEYIRTPNPVYGIQAKGVDGREDPLDTIEAMASYYLEALDALFPAGPYILIGYSFGGLIALEMAERLRDRGKEILLLLLLDTYPHPRFLRIPVRLSLFLRRIRTHAYQMSQMPVRAAWSYFLKKALNQLHLSSTIESSESSDTQSPFIDSPLSRVKQKAWLAYTQFRPRNYPGKIAFVTTETKTFFPPDPAAAWKHVLTDLEVEAVPGDHLSIMTSDALVLGALITRYVEKATDRRKQSLPSNLSPVSLQTQNNVSDPQPCG